MKTIIAGSRSVTSYSTVKNAIMLSKFNITEVVSGTARGADRLGETWAESMGVNVARFPAYWENHGRSAGYIRNAEMADYADALIAIWDGQSRGTKHMIDEAKKKGLKVYIQRVPKMLIKDKTMSTQVTAIKNGERVVVSTHTSRAEAFKCINKSLEENDAFFEAYSHFEFNEGTVSYGGKFIPKSEKDKTSE